VPLTYDLGRRRRLVSRRWLPLEEVAHVERFGDVYPIGSDGGPAIDADSIAHIRAKSRKGREKAHPR
jgi:hypothetical protein